MATYLAEYCNTNDKHVRVFCYNNYRFVVTGSMFGMQQHACVSFFLGGSKFVNGLGALFGDFKTLFLTGNKENLATEFLGIWIIFPSFT